MFDLQDLILALVIGLCFLGFVVLVAVKLLSYFGVI